MWPSRSAGFATPRQTNSSDGVARRVNCNSRRRTFSRHPTPLPRRCVEFFCRRAAQSQFDSPASPQGPQGPLGEVSNQQLNDAPAPAPAPTRTLWSFCHPTPIKPRSSQRSTRCSQPNADETLNFSLCILHSPRCDTPFADPETESLRQKLNELITAQRR